MHMHRSVDMWRGWYDKLSVKDQCPFLGFCSHPVRPFVLFKGAEMRQLGTSITSAKELLNNVAKELQKSGVVPRAVKKKSGLVPRAVKKKSPEWYHVLYGVCTS